MGSGVGGGGGGLAVRVLHLVFGAFVLACAIEMVDQRGVFGDDSAFAATADYLRDARSGDLSVDWIADRGDADPFLGELTGSFDELTRALD